MLIGAVVLTFLPIEFGEQRLREQLGIYENFGALAFSLRLAATLILSAGVVFGLIRPWARARSPHGSAWAGSASVLAILGSLYLPVWTWMALGTLNASLDRSPPVLRELRYISTERRLKGRDVSHYVAVDDPDTTFSLMELHPPPDTAPGGVVTYYQHRGGLLLPFLSLRP